MRCGDVRWRGGVYVDGGSHCVLLIFGGSALYLESLILLPSHLSPCSLCYLDIDMQHIALLLWALLMTWICSDCPSEFAFQLCFYVLHSSLGGHVPGHQQAPGIQIIARLLNTAYGMVYERKTQCSHITRTKTQEPSIDVFSELCLMWLFLWTLTDELVHIYSCRETLTPRSCAHALRLCYSQPLMWETNYRRPIWTHTHFTLLNPSLTPFY